MLAQTGVEGFSGFPNVFIVVGKIFKKNTVTHSDFYNRTHSGGYSIGSSAVLLHFSITVYSFTTLEKNRNNLDAIMQILLRGVREQKKNYY